MAGPDRGCDSVSSWRRRPATVFSVGSGVSRFASQLDFLLGGWEGAGEGLWRSGFRFHDHICFEHHGRPWVEYHQLTRLPDGTTSHGESGYLLPAEDGTVQMVVAQPSGLTETLFGGPIGENDLSLSSAAVGRATGALPVTATSRRFRLENGELVVEVGVAMNYEPLNPHTHSVLNRKEASAEE